MGNLTKLTASVVGRPVLMERGAIETWADKIRRIDARAFERPGRLSALMRKLAGSMPPATMHDEDDAPSVAFERALAYSPLYIGEPDDSGFCWTLKNGVALMCVDTPLLDEGEVYCGTCYHGYDTILAAMQEAYADARVGGIFLKMNCPGGFATGGVMTLAKWMREHRATAGGKPIHVYAKMACSGAQWIAAQADKTICPELAYVGSIGAYCIHEDWSGAYAQMGLKIEEFAMFENKTDGADYKPMSELGTADAMSEIAQIVGYFVSDMIAGRPNLTADAIKAMRSRAFYSRNDDPTRSGVALGLVDEIADEVTAFNDLVSRISGPAGNDSEGTARAGSAAAFPSKEQSMAVQNGKAAHVADLEKQNTANDAASDDRKGNPSAPEDGTNPNEEDETDDAAEIAASDEAKDDPATALAAIQQGLTFAQFKGMAAAAKMGSRHGNLGRALSGSQRLGPDASNVSSSYGSALIADAKRRACEAKR